MMLHKSSVVVLLLLTGALPVALLSGCRRGHMPAVQEQGGGSGPLTIAKMGGDIDVADAPQGANLNTMGGGIHVGNAGAPVKAQTMGGDIAVDRVNGSVDASTMGGKIRIGEANGAVKASTMAGDIKARVVGSSSSERDIELSSNSGTIELVVPKDFPMEVKITLAYTRDSSRNYQVVDSIGLIQQTTDDWDMSQGSPRKYIRAKGLVGSGMNHVTIKTINGDVILKQE
jgi:DUF4097 and DUF4098 domain-containing protein YvlB